MPHKNIDVVVCGSATVMALQTVVSRLTDPLKSAVLSTTVFRAGGAASNVMGDTAVLAGTFRALDKDIFEWLHGRIKHVTEATAAAHGCTANVDFAPAMDGITREVSGGGGGDGGGGGEAPVNDHVSIFFYYFFCRATTTTHAAWMISFFEKLPNISRSLSSFASFSIRLSLLTHRQP